VIRWPATSCNLKVKVATRIFKAKRLDNWTVPCKLQQWDRYRVPQNVFLFLPNFPQNWHLHNAFSIGVLKHFTGVVSEPIIAVHSSNDVPWRPPTPECQKRVKGGVARVTWPLKFWVLNANSSKMTKDMNFKFGTHAPRESRDIAPGIFSKRGASSGSGDPLIFWALNANNSKMTKGTNL